MVQDFITGFYQTGKIPAAPRQVF